MLTSDFILSTFAGARPAGSVCNEILSKLESEYGLDLNRALLAHCLCSDDINANSLPLAKRVYGPFNLGGLGGFPFSGRTGMTAYAHHIPDHGTALILYGPHIGVNANQNSTADDAGEFGTMYRPGQSGLSSSCGALMLALSRMRGFIDEQAHPDQDGESFDNDHQQRVLESTLRHYQQRILGSSKPQVEITECTYEIIDKELLRLIEITKSEFHASHIVLIGGIIINTSPEEEDWFDLRRMEVIRLSH